MTSPRSGTPDSTRSARVRLGAATLACALLSSLFVAATSSTAGAVDGAAVCASMRQAVAGSTVVVPVGTWAIGDCRIDGVGRSGVSVVAQAPVGESKAVLVGMLQCTKCDNWRFEGLNVVGGAPAADPAYVVRMRGGSWWSWTGCDISNGVGPTGERYGVRGLFTTTDEVLNWRLEGCNIHDNGSSRPAVANNNYDHLLYLNGYAFTASSNGVVTNNVFSHNRWGAPVKIGYGLSGGVPTGIPGVSFTFNRLVSNSSPDGICGVNVAGNSPNTVVANNTIDCTDVPVERTRTAIAVRDWVAGVRVTITNNTVTGAHNAGAATGCGTPVSGAYDNTITVQSQLPFKGSWQLRPGSCSWNGISASNNTTTR